MRCISNKMTTVKTKKPKEGAEEKIIQAARKLFTEKGFDAVKTRDIAKEAGINLALLNYYFRSKENLFEIVMRENMGSFMNVISEIVNNKETTIKEKIEALVSNYIRMLTINPNIPLFVLSQGKSDDIRMKFREKFQGSYFMEQINKAIKKGKITKMDPTNLMLNIVGLTIFPFVARRIFQSNNTVTDEQFNKLMMERKEMIPIWINAMLKVK